MEPLLYLVRANLAFVLLYGGYHLFLRKAPRLAANRAWLLGVPVAAFLMPLVPLPATGAMPGIIDLEPFRVGAGQRAPGAATIGPLAWHTVQLVYLAGVFLALALLAVRYSRAWRNSRKVSGEALAFFGRIVLPAGLVGADQRALLVHEQVHVKLGHSYDVLFYEVLSAVSWWNPCWRAALGELRMVHELQADAVASTQHTDYRRLLLAHALGVPTSSLVNSFRSSNLKRRMAMLNQPTSRFSDLRYALALPVLLAAVLAVSCAKQENRPAPVEPIVDLASVEVQPEFPGGMEALYDYLHKTIVFPEQALRDSVQGKVFISFLVGSDGQVRDAVVRRGVRQDVDAEALRAVNAMPAWVPGRVGGEPVAVRFTLPVAFVPGG